MRKLLASLTLTSGIAFAIPAAAGQITIGTPDTQNCLPFFCNESSTTVGYSIDYQQVYSSSLFFGPTQITSVTGFFDSGSGSGFVTAAESYEIYWGYAPLGSVGNLSTDLASNVLGSMTFLESFGAFSGQFNDDPIGDLPFGFVGFNYDPSIGDLLLEFKAYGQSDEFGGYQLADDTGSVTSRALCITGWGCVADHIGLYGVFNTADPVDAPEPASIALFAAGFTGLRRMRKRALPRS